MNLVDVAPTALAALGLPRRPRCRGPLWNPARQMDETFSRKPSLAR